MWIESARPVATLIGDVVGSRRTADRTVLHEALLAAIQEVNAAGPVVPLRITLGDEFQGVFRDVPAAVGAMLTLRLRLLGATGPAGPVTDTRYGLGWGPVQLLEPDTGVHGVQDGPGWWSARRAIEEVAEAGSHRRGGALRARFCDTADPDARPYADAGGTPLAGLVNATLGTLDELVAGLSDLDVRLIRGTAAGLTQSQLAAAEGITQSAVSQRLARNGSWALLAALRALWAPESAS